MKKEVIVMSLGGSLIIPKKIDYKFLKKFKQTLEKNLKKYRFIIVCGGGSTARKEISFLRKQKKSIKEQSLAGIRATRKNAELMIKVFGKSSNQKIPKSMRDVKSTLQKNNIVFCGALEYHSKETSDGTTAKLADFLKTIFINITNVSGLYTSNPKTNSKAKLIPKISWKDFETSVLKIKYKPGQHFILDQNAAKIIKKHKIKTYIIGPNSKNLDNLLNKKKFIGTTISG